MTIPFRIQITTNIQNERLRHLNDDTKIKMTIKKCKMAIKKVKVMIKKSKVMNENSKYII